MEQTARGTSSFRRGNVDMDSEEAGCEKVDWLNMGFCESGNK
jgi:hypothetical protein